MKDPIEHKHAGTPWWAPWVVMGVLFFAWIGSTLYFAHLESKSLQGRQVIRDTQVQSCERVNLLRAEVNDHVEILDEFLHTAALARIAAGDNDVADSYHDMARRLEPVPIPDCEELFPEQAFFEGPERFEIARSTD